MATGTATLDFGAFPGASDASVAVTGQAAIVAGSLVEAWIRPVATADHTDTEHMVETLKVFAANIVAATGFTIYGFNTSEINEPDPPPLKPQFQQRHTSNTAVAWTAMPLDAAQGRAEVRDSRATRIYGTWTIAWAWV
jgi:hypothetical protein